MNDKLPCPTCGAALRVLGERLGTDLRCPSCGQRLKVSLVEGAIELTIRATATPYIPLRHERRRKMRDWRSALPIIVPLIALGVIAVAILVRVVRDTSEKPAVQQAKVVSRAPMAPKHVDRPPSKAQQQMSEREKEIHDFANGPGYRFGVSVKVDFVWAGGLVSKDRC